MNIQAILYEGELRLYSKEKGRLIRIILRTIISIEVNPAAMDQFIILSPSFRFVFQCKHEIAAVDWVNSLRSQATTKEKSLLSNLFNLESSEESNNLIPVTVAQHNCYIYSGKSLQGNMWLGLLKESTTKVKRKKKIKVSTFVIGRSASCNLKLKDPFTSRSHCKIMIIEGVPYLCDMGQSNKGKLF